MSPPALVRQYDVRSADGTLLRAWTNAGSGPPVVVSNGLGTSPQAWPSLMQPDSGLRAIGWYHRGVGGSERPTSGRIDMDAHIDDILAIMDDADVESSVIAGWSIGVNVAFELATRHPDRVRAILAVAGVPGDSFASMLSPLRVPPAAARAVMVGVSRLGTVAGHGLAPVWLRWPWTPFSVGLVRAARVMSADVIAMQPVIQEFFGTHPAWYAQLAMAASRHSRVSLSSIDVPTTFIAGSADIFAGSRDMHSAAARISGARYREVRGTHFLPLEQPELVLDELRLLLERVATHRVR